MTSHATRSIHVFTIDGMGQTRVLVKESQAEEARGDSGREGRGEEAGEFNRSHDPLLSILDLLSMIAINVPTIHATEFGGDRRTEAKYATIVEDELAATRAETDPTAFETHVAFKACA